MPDHSDSITLVEEYLKFLSDHAGVGLEMVTDRDLGEGILGPDFGAQLITICGVLERNRGKRGKPSQPCPTTKPRNQPQTSLHRAR